MSTENVEWKPIIGSGGRIPSESSKSLRNLKIGDIKRITHDDVSCNIRSKGPYGPHCSLGQEIGRLRKLGWHLEYYHEKAHVLVIRRLE